MWLGRSPLWIAQMFETLSQNKGWGIKSIRMPYSGGRDTMDFTQWDFGRLEKGDTSGNPICESMRHYEDYMKSLGLHKLLDTHQSVALIDRWETGASTIGFKMMLGNIDPRFDTHSSVIALTSMRMDLNPSKQGPFKISQIKIKDGTLTKTIQKHADEQAYSMGFPFHPEIWPNWKKIEQYQYEPSPIVRARIEQIQDWVDQQGQGRSLDDRLL